MDKTILQDEIFVTADVEQELKKAAMERKKHEQIQNESLPLSVRAKRLQVMYNALDKVKHDMTLADLPYTQIRDGIKTVEVRLFDEKRQKIKVGDIICFTRRGTQEALHAEVTALYKYGTFIELFSSEHFGKTGFIGFLPCEAANKMYDYYDKANEQKCGVLGIEIKVAKNQASLANEMGKRN